MERGGRLHGDKDDNGVVRFSRWEVEKVRAHGPMLACLMVNRVLASLVLFSTTLASTQACDASSAEDTPKGPTTDASSAVDAGGTETSTPHDGGPHDGDASQQEAGASGARPTRDNTGPRHALTALTADDFFTTRVCNRQRIDGDVRFDQPSIKGKTFAITDCEITGNLYVYLNGGGNQLPLQEMPTIGIDYSDILGGVSAVNASKMTIDHSYVAGGQWTLKDVWTPFVDGPAPYRIANSLFYGVYQAQPAHTEALHVADYGTGITFTNVAFVQQGGPLANTGVTAVINYHGAGTVFDGCWFLWDGPVPAYYTVYIDGPGNVVKRSWFGSGAAYVYPSSDTMATYDSNRNVDTGALLTLP